MALAMFDFTPEYANELPFQSGDVIDNIGGTADTDWFIGSLNGKFGLLPGTFVCVFNTTEGNYTSVLVGKSVNSTNFVLCM